MQCSRVQEQLIRYAEGALSSQDASRIRTHLAECAECARELRATTSAAGRLRSCAPPACEPSEDLWRRVAVRLPEGRRARRQTWNWAFAGAAAVLLVVAALSAPTLFNGSDEQVAVKGSSTPVVTAPTVDTNSPASTTETAAQPEQSPGGSKDVKGGSSEGTFTVAPERSLVQGASGHRSPTGKATVRMAANGSHGRGSRVETARERPSVPFATDADRLAHGIKEQPKWAVAQDDPDKAARDEASSLFSY